MTDTAKHYDIIILGTGSGNSIPGPEFDDKTIAIVEKGTFGGTCLNVGCIPTKMFVYPADLAQQVSEATRLGFAPASLALDWSTLQDRIFASRIDPIAEGGENYRRGNECPNIDVYAAEAHFIGERTLAVGGTTISADTIVVATGSRPNILPVIAESGVPYDTNETIMRLPQQPASLIVLGGGYIAMEFAHVFEALGTDVTIVNRSENLLRHLDEELVERFNKVAQERFTTRLGRTVTNARYENDLVTLTLDNGEEVSAERLLVATGRTPNAAVLAPEKAGIELDGERIRVDEYGRTTAPGVWAFGDVSSPYQLKHVANAEMRAVRHNLLHPEDLQEMPHEHVPSAIFTHPQIGSVGLTEAEARDAGYDITVKVQEYGDVAFGWAMEEHTGVVKLIADKKTGLLLGAHVLGEQAATLAQQLVTFMAFKIDCRDAARGQYWIHPALPEVIENALLGLEF